MASAMATTTTPPARCRPHAEGAARWSGARRSSTDRRSARSGSWASPGIILMVFVARPPDRQPQAVPLEGGAEPLRRGAPRHPGPPAAAHVLLWTVRIGLIAAFVFHIHARVRLTIHEPPAPGPTATSRSATTSPPTSRRARCAGPASSSPCSSSSTSLDLTWGTANSDFVRGDPYNNLVYSIAAARSSRSSTSLANIALGVPPVPRRRGRCSRASGINNPQYNKARRRFATGVRRRHPRRQPVVPDRGATRSRRDRVPEHGSGRRLHGGLRRMTLDSKVPEGALTEKWDNHKFDDQARQPVEQAALRHHRRRYRPGRRVGGRVARRARLQREGHHLPRLAPPRALDRRAGRHQRGQELQERRRQHLPAVLRHDQGRRLPRPRRQRVPARAGVGRHHRPVRRAGRAVRA